MSAAQNRYDINPPDTIRRSACLVIEFSELYEDEMERLKEALKEAAQECMNKATNNRKPAPKTHEIKVEITETKK